MTTKSKRIDMLIRERNKLRAQWKANRKNASSCSAI